MEKANASRGELIAQLEWYRAAGVDLCVTETPVNQFEIANKAVQKQAPKAIPAQASAPPPTPPAANAPVGNDINPDEARELAASARTLDELRAKMDTYNGCPLKLRATQLVFADGNPEANIMLVGEAPGRDEDLQGKPFVGRSGQLLDKMLAAIGLDRTKVYIANTVPWRPPGNRTPTPAEISVCLPFIHRQIELVGPKIIMTLGSAATQTMFGEKLSIIKTRGKWRDIEIGGQNIRAMPTLHPAFLLRQPLQKRNVWNDLLAVKTALEELDA